MSPLRGIAENICSSRISGFDHSLQSFSNASYCAADKGSEIEDLFGRLNWAAPFHPHEHANPGSDVFVGLELIFPHFASATDWFRWCDELYEDSTYLLSKFGVPPASDVDN